LDCGEKGCLKGGFHFDVWPFLTNHGGAVRTADYNPYTAVKNSSVCNWNLLKDERAITDIWYAYLSWPNVHAEANVECYLINQGPVDAQIWADQELFQLGPLGVYDNPSGSCLNNSTNHAVMLIVYGTSTNSVTGEKIVYWLLKNQWGTSWGKTYAQF
jgi:hypothetical protein